ncbi:hypothetical protein [Borreliella finlandensis]
MYNKMLNDGKDSYEKE